MGNKLKEFLYFIIRKVQIIRNIFSGMHRSISAVPVGDGLRLGNYSRTVVKKKKILNDTKREKEREMYVRACRAENTNIVVDTTSTRKTRRNSRKCVIFQKYLCVYIYILYVYFSPSGVFMAVFLVYVFLRVPASQWTTLRLSRPVFSARASHGIARGAMRAVGPGEFSGNRRATTVIQLLFKIGVGPAKTVIRRRVAGCCARRELRAKPNRFGEEPRRV